LVGLFRGPAAILRPASADQISRAFILIEAHTQSLFYFCTLASQNLLPMDLNLSSGNVPPLHAG